MSVRLNSTPIPTKSRPNIPPDSDEQKEFLRTHPDEYLAYRKMIEHEINTRFHLILNGTPEAKEARDFSTQEMTRKLATNPSLLDAIIPKDFGVGCRRPTPGTEGYLEAISGPKTTMYHQTLHKITEKGFIPAEDPEKVVEVDTIICATGFDTSFCPNFELKVNGKSINEKLYSSPEKTLSYLALALPEVPNYMIFCGAFGPVAHGSFFPLIEAFTNYAIQLITKLQTERIRSVRPKLSPCIQFRQHAELFLKRTAWTGPCSSWFKGGKVDALPLLWPGSRCQFLKLIEGVRWEDYEIEHEGDGNMWSFLGNGFNVIENEADRDITWYLGEQEKEVDMERVREVMKGF
jgi:cation diffusion facilitator CzcD-associated flavoprotein CzcO